MPASPPETVKSRALLAGVGILIAALLIDRWQARPRTMAGVEARPGSGDATNAPRARSGPAVPAIPGSSAGSRPGNPWARITTRGNLIEVSKIASDIPYSLRVQRHVQLRALLNSPARDTAECIQLGQLAEAYGFPLEIVPMAYRYAWERKMIGEQFAKPEDDAERQIRLEMADSDFEVHLQSAHGKHSREFRDAVRAVDPKVAFGHISKGVRDGEALLEE